ncbi:MAG: hypothetical protein JW850_03380 [Thermoflexales bacterium]|nr:hypothetical protein [Thermoflexales bacterium]
MILLSWSQLVILAILWLAAFLFARWRGGPRALHLDVAAIGGLALACLGFYWQIFFNGAWMPPGGGDIASFLWPMYSFAARSLKAGVLPLWNPHLYAGAPFAADNQSGLFYPINVLVFLLAPTLTYETVELLSVWHVWWAGVGTYVLLRDMSTRRLPALGGALAFMFSDLFVTHFGNTNLIAVAAWLPWVFAAFRRARGPRGSYRWALAAGALWGIAALAGHMQITLLIGLWLAGYALYQAGLELAKGGPALPRRKLGRALRPLLVAILSGGVMLGFAALMLIPAYEMARYTGRAALAYDEAARYSLPPAALLGLVVPGLFGRGAGALPAWERVEVGYIGILPLALAPLAGALGGRRRKGSETAFLAIAALAALALAMGGYSVLHGWVYRFVPGFNQMRAPARAVLLFDFSVALLAGLALDAWLSALSRRARRALQAAARGLAWLGVGLAGMGLPLLYFMVTMSRGDTGLLGRNVAVFNGLAMAILLVGASALLMLARASAWLKPRAVSVLAIALLAFDLFTLGSPVDIEPNDPASGSQYPKIVSFLSEQADLFRIEVASGLWQPDAALLHGLYDVGGIYNPLSLAAYQTYVGGMGSRGSPLYNALNVKYVLADKGQPPGDARFVPVMADDPRLDVYLNTAALPRAWLVGSSVVVSGGGQAWQAIHAPDFDPSITVVVENGVELDSSLPPGDAHLAIERYSANEMHLSANVPVPAYLVLSEVYYPGWRAWVDERPVAVLPADFVLRAVYLEPGVHRLRLAFQPSSWTLGLLVSIITWLALAVVSLAARRPK